MIRLRSSLAVMLLVLTATAFAQEPLKTGEKRQKLRKQALTLTQSVETTNGDVLAAGTYDIEVTNDSKRRMVLVFVQDGKKVGETLAELRGFAPGTKVGILCDDIVADGSKAGILCDGHAAILCNDHGSIQCNEHHAKIQCNAHETKLQCDAHSAKIQCNAHETKFQCDAHSAKIQCDAHSAKIQCNAQGAKIQCNDHTKLQCNDHAKLQCNAHGVKIQCDAHGVSIQCNLRASAGTLAFKQLGFGAKSPVLFDASKGTLSIIAATGDHAGRGSIEAKLVPVQ